MSRPSLKCFNTQPPEGGWAPSSSASKYRHSEMFQHTAARRRLVAQVVVTWIIFVVSTHSRPKAAVCDFLCLFFWHIVSTHSRPKAAGPANPTFSLGVLGFNTQPPEGGWKRKPSQNIKHSMFQHTAARRRLANHLLMFFFQRWFQHTAARRRLVMTRPKALRLSCFNTQPPEGGWRIKTALYIPPIGFNTQPPEGGWYIAEMQSIEVTRFNTQPPEGGWRKT